MTRREEREQTFVLLFERQFHPDALELMIENAGLARDQIISGYTKTIVNGVAEKESMLNKTISAHIRGWTIQRLPKVTIALLQLAIYEIYYCADIPTKVSINEVIELAKQYGGEDDAAYINGVLGSVVKEWEANDSNSGD